MLLRPAMTDILKPGESYYEFVVQVAREARKIADEERKLIETEKDVPSKLEKPVTAAVQKFSISLKNSCRVSSWFGRNEPSS